MLPPIYIYRSFASKLLLKKLFQSTTEYGVDCLLWQARCPRNPLWLCVIRNNGDTFQGSRSKKRIHSPNAPLRVPTWSPTTTAILRSTSNGNNTVLHTSTFNAVACTEYSWSCSPYQFPLLLHNHAIKEHGNVVALHASPVAKLSSWMQKKAAAHSAALFLADGPSSLQQWFSPSRFMLTTEVCYFSTTTTTTTTTTCHSYSKM